MAYTTINKSTDYFTPFTFTGTGSSGTRTGVGFTPDMFIHKNRDNTQGWGVIDVIRGNGNYLGTNTTNAELSDVGNYGITTDGYTFPNGDSFFNGSGNNMVFWNWKAGGTASSNTDGSITSSVSANTTAGFSIVSYTGTAANATVGHGLGSAPNVIFFKSRGNASTNWYVYHSSLGEGTRITLNSTGASSSDTEYINNTAPTSSVFSLGANGTTNPSTTQIAYCFAEKPGYSKFGKYVGNGNSSGPFVYTGFKPAFVIQKNTSAVQGWQLQDNKRLGYNPNNYLLQPHDNAAESAVSRLDLLSNGFKIRTTDAGQNSNGATYIYMAFGQSLVGDNNVPCTAR